MAGKQSLIEAYLKNLDKKMAAAKLTDYASAGQSRIKNAAAIQGTKSYMPTLAVPTAGVLAQPASAEPLYFKPVEKQAEENTVVQPEPTAFMKAVSEPAREGRGVRTEEYARQAMKGNAAKGSAFDTIVPEREGRGVRNEQYFVQALKQSEKESQPAVQPVYRPSAEILADLEAAQAAADTAQKKAQAAPYFGMARVPRTVAAGQPVDFDTGDARALQQEVEALETEYYYAVNAEAFAALTDKEREMLLLAAEETQKAKDSRVQQVIGNAAAGLYDQAPDLTLHTTPITDQLRNTLKTEDFDSLLEYAIRLYNGEQQALRSTAVQAWAKDNPTGAFFAQAAVNLGSPLANLDVMANRVKNFGAASTEYTPLDTSSPLWSASHATQDLISGGVAGVEERNSGKWLGESAGILGGQEIGSWLYQTGASGLSNIVNIGVSALVTGGLGLTGQAATKAMSTITSAAMGSQVVANSILANKEAGMSDSEAVSLGIMSGVIEAVTEKIGLDTLLSADGTAIAKAMQKLIKNPVANSVIKGMIAEGGEELASNYLNRIADALVRGDENTVKQMYELELQRTGDPNKAFMNTVLALAGEDASAFLGGSLMGGLMGSAQAGANAVMQNAAAKQNAASAPQMAENAAENAAVQDDGDKAETAEKAPDGVVEYAQQAQQAQERHAQHPNAKKERLSPKIVSVTTEKMDNAIRDLSGETGASVDVVLDQNTAERLLKEGLSAEDISNAMYVLEDFDEAYLSTKTSARFRSKDGGSAKQITFIKNAGDGAVVVDLALDTRSGRYAVANVSYDPDTVSTIKAWDGNIDMVPQKASEAPVQSAYEASNTDKESVSAKKAAYKYREDKTQTASIAAQDQMLNMTDEEKAKYGAPKDNKHQVISWAQQKENARQIVQQKNRNDKNYGINKSFEDLINATGWNSEQVAVAYELRRELLKIVRTGTDAEKVEANKKLLALAGDMVDRNSDIGRALGYMSSFVHRSADDVLNGIITEYRKAVKELHGFGLDYWKALQPKLQQSIDEMRKAAQTSKAVAEVENTIRKLLKKTGVDLSDAQISDLVKSFWNGASADDMAAYIAKEYGKSKGLDIDISDMGEQLEALRKGAKTAQSAADIEKKIKTLLDKREIPLPDADIEHLVKSFWDGASAAELKAQIVEAYGRSKGIDINIEKEALREAITKARKDINAAGEIVKALRAEKINVSEGARRKLDELFWSGANAEDFKTVIEQDKIGDVLTAEEMGKIADILEQAEALEEEYGADSKQVIDLQTQAFAIAAEKMGHSGSWFDTLRYAAMLFNVKANEKNGIGNMVNAAHDRFSDVIARGIEERLAKKGKLNVRTKAKNTTAELRGACFADAQRNYGKLTGNSIVSTARGIEAQRRRVTTNKLQKGILWLSDAATSPLEQSDQKGVYGVLAGAGLYSKKAGEWYDALDKKQTDKRLSGKIGLCGLDNAYANALSQYLTANGENESIFAFENDLTQKTKNGGYELTEADKARLETLKRAREYATAAAKEVTFHSYDQLADYLNGMSQGKAGKMAQTVAKGVLPYLLTPINIAKTSVKYSPLGLAETVIIERQRMAKGEITQAQFIKRMAQGLTGTAEFAVGVVLGMLGVITGSIGNDKEDKYRKQLGEQAYSINLGKLGTYTIDWLFAANPGILIGASTVDAIKKAGLDEATSVGDVFNVTMEVITGSFKPLLELSLVDSLNDALENAGYGKSAVPAFVANSLISLAEQFSPSLLGQIARGIAGKRKSTYSKETGAAGDVAYAVKSIQNRMPLLANASEDYIDVWGNTQPNYGLLYQLFSPGYYGKNIETKTDTELLRLYGATGDSGVLPSTANTGAVKLDGKNRKLTAKEYSTFAKESGKADYDLSKSFLESALYKTLDDDDRANIVGALHSFSNAYGYYKLDAGYKPSDTDMARIECYEKYGAEMTALYMASNTLKDAEGKAFDNAERLAFIDGLSVSESDKAILYALGGGKAGEIYSQSAGAGNLWYTMMRDADTDGKEGVATAEGLIYLKGQKGSSQDKGYVLWGLQPGKNTDPTAVVNKYGEGALASWYDYYSVLYNDALAYKEKQGNEHVSLGTSRQRQLARETLAGMKIPDEQKAYYWDLITKDTAWQKRNPFD